MLTTPAITGVNPAFPVATGSAQPFTINGSSFLSGCTVTLVDGGGVGTTFANMPISSQSSTQIVVNPNFGTGQDVWGVEVINPGSATSNEYYFATTPSGASSSNRFGVDYSSGRPSMSSLQSAGSNFVVRYVNYIGNPKDITLSEAQSLFGAGQQIILVFESTANEMLNGYNAGVADAQEAANEAVKAGAPSNFFCYFAADFDATEANQTPINAYLNGAASVLGLSRVGIYGGYYPVSRALTAGAASKGWQTVAWSGGQVYSGISLYQYANTILSNSSDVDMGIGSNLGQWTPDGLSASATGIQTVSISWSTASVATGYTLDRATSSSGPWTQVYSGSGASFADSGLQFGTTYYYEVCFDNGSGKSSFSPSVSATTLSGIPTGLAATATGSQSISVSWNTVTGATSYTLQRATSSSGPWTQVYSGSTASYSNSGLQPGTTYYYEVKSGTSTGSSVYSSSVSALTYPATPTGLTVSATGPQSISTSWSAMTGATTYALQRATSASGPWTQIYSGSSAQFSDSGLQVGVAYWYEVRSGNSSGNSAYSSAVSATTLKTITWTGGGANANWSTAANWGGVAPVAGCDLDFAAATGLATTNDLAAGTQFGSLTFNAGAGAFTLNGNSVKLSGTITNNSANTQTINLSLGGTNGVTKAGAGMMILSAADSFTGDAVVTGGALKVTAPAVLPDGSNLSVGANVLTVFAAPIVPGDPVPAASASAAIAPAASSNRAVSLRDIANQAAILNSYTRKIPWFETLAETLASDNQQDKNSAALSARDAALAEYGSG